MVELSNDAARLVRKLVTGSALPATAGLHVGTKDDSRTLAMSLQAEPRGDDLILERDGAAVWVSPKAAERLEDHTLEAALEPRPAFFITT